MDYFKKNSNKFSKVFEFCENIGYPIANMKRHRVIGPRPNSTIPPAGAEIFITNIPKHLLEDVLFPYFEVAGSIYTFKLLLNGSSGHVNRGTAYVNYEKSEDAQLAVTYLNGSEIIPGCRITVQKSWDNRRLYVGGIPDHKQKLEVSKRLVEVGMDDIIDVIMYKSYSDMNKNRGYVFVEFATHQLAAAARIMFRGVVLFDVPVSIDWATPLNNISEDVMCRVKKLFLRNLSVNQEKEEFETLINNILGHNNTTKIYKFKDYAFLHFKRRKDACRALNLLEEYYKQNNAVVEVTWAKPPPAKINKLKKRENSGKKKSFVPITN